MVTHPTQTSPANAGAQATQYFRVNDPVQGWTLRPVQDLVMIRGVKGYSWLYWRDGSRQLMAYTLKHYADRISATQYIRVHQNCLINRSFVVRLQLTHKGPQIELLNGERISVSRRRWVLVKRVLMPGDKSALLSTSRLA